MAQACLQLQTGSALCKKRQVATTRTKQASSTSQSHDDQKKWNVGLRRSKKRTLANDGWAGGGGTPCLRVSDWVNAKTHGRKRFPNDESQKSTIRAMSARRMNE